MVAVDNTVQRSIKFKITSKGKRCELEDKSSGNIMMIVNNECRDGVNANGKSIPVKYTKSGNSNKRKPGVILECQGEKKQRTEQSFKEQYSKILRLLMGHPHGFAFNQPIDPVKLKIPDYFSIITEPMDLGKIKCKLEENRYFDAEEFARDVTLTFSNAMVYNPPGNYVYNFAMELNDLFNRRWNLLKAKLNVIDEGTSLELEKAIKVSLDVKEGKGKPARTTQSGCPRLVKTYHKDNGNQSAFATSNKKQPFYFPAVKCATCGSLTCQCSLRCPVKPSSSDFSSERLSDRDHSSDSKLDCKVKYPLTSQARGLSLDSYGHECVPNEDNFQQRVSSPATTAAIDKGWTSPVNMSPKKVLRAAMLKSRFADTISRARHHALLDHDKKINLLSRQKERERLERQQCEEKARIAAENKTAVAASRMRVEMELKTKREKERKAARIALEKMGKTVDIDENRNIMEEFEAIIGGFSSGNLRNPLEQIGLYIKDDYMEEDEEEAILQGEEGEILS
ncbi:transcription factor GTE9-like [Olea europaea var. sylvestris]|uniref:transcription factor GTE9-like n=1 Tax=Olea europaea var. sylvestris TaxID=158386 RepID=UPI000C1D4354|nr:transcription factor GTE9-like [Olea europaea var. sylvestris]